MSAINDLLALSYVPRWAVVRTLRQQTVADHSFRVAIIAMELVQQFHIDWRPDIVIWHALTHDADESVTGDIPAVAKNYGVTKPTGGYIVQLPEGMLPTMEEIRLVKLADIIEAYTWLHMNGDGIHTGKVLKELREEMTNAAEKMGMEDQDIRKLAFQIISEEGRRIT